jgi:hypothetical protein
MAAQTIEVHPNVSRNVVIAVIGCTAFTVGGFWMLLSGEEMLAGLLCVVFFGGGGIYAVPKMLRRRVTMVLTPEGIEQRYVEGNALLDVPAAVTVWTKLKGQGDLEETLGSFGKVGSLTQALLWTREQFGYDLVLSWVEIDRPAAKFAVLLEGYLPKEKQG